MERRGRLKLLFFVRILGVGLLLRLMNWLLKSVGKFTKTSSLNINSQPSPNELSTDSFFTQNLSTGQRFGSNPGNHPTHALSEKGLIGLSSTRRQSSLKRFGSNTSDQRCQIGEGGLYLYQHHGDTIGFTISTLEGSLMIIPNGNLGNIPLILRGTSGIT